MNVNDLPNELLDKILVHLLPDKSCDIEEFKNYFLVNKVWCNRKINYINNIQMKNLHIIH